MFIYLLKLFLLAYPSVFGSWLCFSYHNNYQCWCEQLWKLMMIIKRMEVMLLS